MEKQFPFLDSNLFDELHIYYAPKLLGDGKPLYSGYNKLTKDYKLKLNNIDHFDNDIKVVFLEVIMFTGIIEETGIIKKKISNLDGIELTIHADKVLEDLKVNDSVACSGICLTVTKLMDKSFVVQLVEETIYRTTAKLWNVNTRINLERSLLPTTRLGGHFVQGHVDTVIKINDIRRKTNLLFGILN